MSQIDNNTELKVKKRDGSYEDVSFDKILNRVKNLGQYNNSHLHINYTTLVIKIIDQLYDGIETSQIDELTSEQCASMTTIHPDYGILASRILISNHHKNTEKSFSKVMKQLYDFKDNQNTHFPKISQELYDIVLKHGNKIDKMIDYSRDYDFDYFGFKTLERAYLMRDNKIVIERPQHMWMRVSLGIHSWDLEKAKETYDLMSQKYFTHATPTLFNAGTPRQQLSSCYLIAMEDDSVKGIYNTLSECAQISKYAGGIGLHIHNIRAKGTHIRGTNGYSNGIVPMLKAFNATARYIDQCVTGNTFIYTTQGPMRIQNVYKDETQVFNSKGKHELIENVLEHPYQGTIYSIYTTHSIEPLQITAEHPVYVLSNVLRNIPCKTIEKMLEKNVIQPMWKEVKDLTDDDLILYKVPEYEKDDITITENDCYMYGIILSSGCMLNNKPTSQILLDTDVNDSVLDFIRCYFDTKCIQYIITKENNKIKIVWDKTILLPFRYKDIYNENSEKCIHHKWLHLPLHKVKHIIKGLVDSQHRIKNQNTIQNEIQNTIQNTIQNEIQNEIQKVNDKYVKFYHNSRQLIECIRYILLRLNTLAEGYTTTKINTNTNEITNTNTNEITNTNTCYILHIPNKKIMDNIQEDKTALFFSYNGLLGSRINKIEKTFFKGTLYDLQMRETHNYTIHNGIIHNGGGKRAGSFAIYLETWHADIEDFLQMKKNHGDEELKARDLFYALWVSDLFMNRVKQNKEWTLFCPDKCRNLQDVYGDDFEKLYTHYENEGYGIKKIPARKLWFDILDSQIETGTPYILFKDHANHKSNQKNLGTIKSSNLCVAPETKILTIDNSNVIRNVVIRSLSNQFVNVWNGHEWSYVQVKKTSDNAELMKVEFSNGKSLECTLNHKFYIDIHGNNTEIKFIPAHLLEKNMKLMTFTLPYNMPNNLCNNIYITNITFHKRYSETYCFTENMRHMGVFNGILTGQCSEIIEYSNKDETAVCNLASIGLPKFIEPNPNVELLRKSE
jgi:ribonucleoside-diphosphate reductase alpha chain